MPPVQSVDLQLTQTLMMIMELPASDQPTSKMHCFQAKGALQMILQTCGLPFYLRTCGLLWQALERAEYLSFRDLYCPDEREELNALPVGDVNLHLKTPTKWYSLYHLKNAPGSDLLKEALPTVLKTIEGITRFVSAEMDIWPPAKLATVLLDCQAVVETAWHIMETPINATPETEESETDTSMASLD